MCSLDQPFSLFFWKKTRNAFSALSRAETFSCAKRCPLFSKKCVHFLHFLKDFSRFLFKHLFCVSLFSSFFLPFSSCFSLLVCVFLLVFSNFFVFHLLFHHFSLCSLCFVFLFLFSAQFSCSLSFLLVAIVVWAFFLSPFASPVFFCLFNFCGKKKKLTQFFFEFFLYRTLPSSQTVSSFATVFWTKTLFLFCWSF